MTNIATIKTILVTGAAGFIGYHMVNVLCSQGHSVIGIDSLNDYYDVQLKYNRVQTLLSSFKTFSFYHLDFCNKTEFDKLFIENDINVIINLAAQAGVRYSIDNPYRYIDSNISGFLNVLEACRNFKVQHLIFASSSSVYGANTNTPFSTEDNTDHPISFYGATKKANEAMAHSYASLYNIPCTGLRFFTVYGPWGRPDMAYYLFTDKILKGKPIELFNNGELKRDFTYVEDIVETIAVLINIAPVKVKDNNTHLTSPATSLAPYRIYNIGNHKPVLVSEFVRTLERLIGKKALIYNKPMQKGDMVETYADIEDLSKVVGFVPKTSIYEGLEKFVTWYRSYYKM